MKLWRWQEGRQEGCKYQKFPLWYFRVWKWGFDAYILKYEKDTHLKLHRDKVEGRHWRLNIGWGNSNFHIVGYPGKCGWKKGKLSLYLFRPDLYLHGLSIYEKTIKLSFGFVKFY